MNEWECSGYRRTTWVTAQAVAAPFLIGFRSRWRTPSSCVPNSESNERRPTFTDRIEPSVHPERVMPDRPRTWERPRQEVMWMATTTMEMFVACFDNEKQAGDALKDFQSMHREGSIDLIDAAVIVHGADGKVEFEETADPSGKKWAKRGAIAGGLVGLIFPPSIIASAVVGAGAGGIWGKIRDKGFKDEDLKAIGESLEPGTSAIIAIAEDRMVDAAREGPRGLREDRQAPRHERRGRRRRRGGGRRGG